MSEEQPTPEEHAESDAAERVGEAAGRLGSALGRFARRARSTGADAAFREGKPQLDRAARQVRSQARAAARAARPHVEHAAEAARPRIERAAREAASRTARFAREHEDELRTAASTGAYVVSSRVGPPFLRPVITAVSHEIVRPRPPRIDPALPPPPAAEDADHDGAP